MRILRISVDEKRRSRAIVACFDGSASVFQSFCFAVLILTSQALDRDR
jgi:hypothetical protein